MTSSDRRTWPAAPADVVLGTVRAEDRAEVDRLLREDPAFRAAVDRLGEAGTAVRTLPDAAWRDDAPPALDLDAALRARPARGRERRGAAGGAGLGRGRGRFPQLALAAVAAAVLFGGGLLAGTALDGDATPPVAQEPDGRRVALSALDDGGPQRAAVVMPGQSGGEMELRVKHARPSRAGEYYELWLLDGGKRTTPIGTFRVGADGTARVRFPLSVDPSAYRYLDVSIEPDDGDPAHSSRSVLRSEALS